MKFIEIDGRKIGDGLRPYVIAELSGNHNGRIERAFELMAAAKAAGADAVKLQTYRAETITIDSSRPEFFIKGGLWDGRRLYELYQEAHTPWEWHQALFAKGRDLGITVFSTPFDPTAVNLLEELDVPAYKIASFELVDIPLIRLVAATGKPLIMSTGMANLDEIAVAVAAARDAGCKDLVLLHCVSSYPAPVAQSNLRSIPDLARRFDVLTGLSDHTLGTVAATAAVTLGAVMVEKHVTIRRSEGGVDSGFSLEPAELAQLVADLGAAAEALGMPKYGPTEAERNSLIHRRSLYVVADVAAGDILTVRNVRSIRPALGLPPICLDAVLGRTASRELAFGEPLLWDMVGGLPGRPAPDLRQGAGPRLELENGAFLRPLTVADVTDAYVDGLNDPEVHRFLTGPHRERQTRATVETFVTACLRASDGILFGLFVDGDLRGTVRLHGITEAGAWLGLAIFDKRLWGQKFGRHCIVAVTEYALGQLKLARVEAGIEDGNEASATAFRKAGFHPAGRKGDTAARWIRMAQ